MFYGQFILAKKGALATIWIAAHLDRKLHKKQITETSITQSVDAILEPEVPIALRLSGHLLLGVVRVYSRKVNYLFNDCSDALVKIKQAFRPGAVDLPPDAVTAPFYSITVPDNFDIDDLEHLPGYGDSANVAGGKGWIDLHVTDPESITLAPRDVSWDYFDPSSQFDPEATFGEPVEGTRPLDEEEPEAPEKLRADARAGPSEEPSVFGNVDAGMHMGGGLDDDMMLPPMDDSIFGDHEVPVEKPRSAAYEQGVDVLPDIPEPDGTPLPAQEEMATPLPAEREEPFAAEMPRREGETMMEYDGALPSPPSTTGRAHLDSLPDLATPVHPEEQEPPPPPVEAEPAEPPNGVDGAATTEGRDAAALLPEEAPGPEGEAEPREERQDALQTPLPDVARGKRQAPTPTPAPVAAVAKKMEPPKSTRKRKVVVDEDTTVIKGPVMRVQLVQTDDIRRVRKRAPHLPEELRAWKMQAHGVDPFTLPSVHGMAPQLVGLFRRVLGEGRPTASRKRGASPEPPAVTPADKAPRIDVPIRSADTNVHLQEEPEEDEKIEGLEGTQTGTQQTGTPTVNLANEETQPEVNGAEEEVEVLRGAVGGLGAGERDGEETIPLEETQEERPLDGAAGTDGSPLQDIGGGENGLPHAANGDLDKPYQVGGIEEDELPSPPVGKPPGGEETGEVGGGMDAETELVAPMTEDIPGTAGAADSPWPVPEEETPARGDAAQKFADGLDFLADGAPANDGEQADEAEDDEEHEEEGQRGKAKIDDGWSSRTRAVGKYLRGAFEGLGADARTKESQMPELGISQMLLGKSRREAARLYFEVLLLKTRDYIHVEQTEPYGEIMISGKQALMKSNL